MFEMIRAEFLQDQENERTTRTEQIINGTDQGADSALKWYATNHVWTEYQAGRMTRERATALTIRRLNKKIEKATARGLARLETAAAAADLDYISVNVTYKHSSYSGYNPTATVYANERTTGSAYGGGYDKESAAVASAFNLNPAILKILYSVKEAGLAEGKSSASKTAITGRDNRDVCGYGSGYTSIPYFEGGVGVNCFWRILERAGFKVSCNYGKHENYYTITKQ